MHDSAANPVFRALRDLGLDRDGPIAVEQVDASLTSTARAGGGIGSPAREIAPVWEMVTATIRAGAVYSPSFFALLAVAGLIGAVGILTNSQILIVGAMVAVAAQCCRAVIPPHAWRGLHQPDGMKDLSSSL